MASGESAEEDKSFQNLADGAPVMIWMSGLDMGCFYFNRAWLDFRGRTVAEEAGNGWAEGVHSEDVQRCVNHYVGCFEQRTAFAMNYRLKDAAGEYRWILDRGAPHFSLEGSFLGFFGGCAETEEHSPDMLNAKLRVSLGEVEAFARGMAEKKAAVAPELAGDLGRPLRALAHTLHSSHLARARRVHHVAVELEKLATDMLAYGKIPRGACVT